MSIIPSLKKRSIYKGGYLKAKRCFRTKMKVLVFHQKETRSLGLVKQSKSKVLKDTCITTECNI